MIQPIENQPDVILRLSRQIINLPPLPAVTTRLLQLIDNPQSSPVQIAQLLASDQAMTVRLLRLANSPYYGFSHEIRTVPLAVTLLGNDTIANLALSVSVLNHFNITTNSDAFDRMRFWEHSLLVAHLAIRLAKSLQILQSSELFTAGILHDIGKLVIHEFFHSQYLQIEQSVAIRGISSLQAEREIMGTDHAAIGDWLCRHWNLPGDIASAVGDHHPPLLDRKIELLPATIHLADQLANRHGRACPDRVYLESDTDLDSVRILMPYTEDHQLDWVSLQPLVEEEIQRTADFIAMLNVGQPSNLKQ